MMQRRALVYAAVIAGLYSIGAAAQAAPPLARPSWVAIASYLASDQEIEEKVAVTLRRIGVRFVVTNSIGATVSVPSTAAQRSRLALRALNIGATRLTLHP